MPQLTPEAAIARITDWDGLDVSCEVLGGGITNHNYLLSVTGRPDIPWGGKYVMRIPGDGTETFIDREREHKNHVAAAKAGVTPPVLYTLEPEKCTVVPFIEGETMHPQTLAGDRERLGKVVDVIRELEKFGATVDVYDPWVDAAEARHEYGVKPIKTPKARHYDAVVLAVAHKQFAELGVARVRGYAKKLHVLYDIKHLFARADVDGRL